MTEKEIAARLRKTGYPVDPDGLAILIAGFVKQEREACAKLVEKYGMEDPEVSIDVTKDIARLIRS